LGAAAGKISKVVQTNTLHKMWQRLPPSVRALTRRGKTKSCSEADFTLRQQNTADAFRRCDVVISPSLWLKKEAESHKLGEVLHIPHGVDIAPGERDTNSDFFLFLGSIAPHKGPHLVADAWLAATEEVGKEEKLPKLRIVGPIVDAKYAETIPGHLLEPPLTPEMVPRVLREARALIVGSMWPENSPLVILEALAAGCPVIAPDIGGIPEILNDGVDGILYKAGDADSLKRAILQLSKSDFTPKPPPTFTEHTCEIDSLYRSLLEARA
jgi:glycosyltransferase involved in cell wall biosynthesis